MEFIRNNMDIDKIYDKKMTKKIKMFYDSLDWGKPVDKEQTIEDFFNFEQTCIYVYTEY